MHRHKLPGEEREEGYRARRVQEQSGEEMRVPKVQLEPPKEVRGGSVGGAAVIGDPRSESRKTDQT